jgi:AcrR family transcriptional regulator
MSVEHETTSKTEARRQQILDAMCHCVRRDGFHGASMAEIAKAAGLSVGQIYRYFANKEAMISALVGQDLVTMREKFAQILATPGSAVDTIIESCAEGLERNYDPDRAALTLEVLAEAARNPKVAAMVRDADSQERDLVLKLLSAVRRPGWSQAEFEARGEMLSMLFDGMIIRSVNNPDVDRSAMKAVLQSVLRGLLETDQAA